MENRVNCKAAKSSSELLVSVWNQHPCTPTDTADANQESSSVSQPITNLLHEHCVRLRSFCPAFHLRCRNSTRNISESCLNYADEEHDG